jgi:ATP phosphoribosyltransferase regulatory subunit
LVEDSGRDEGLNVTSKGKNTELTAAERQARLLDCLIGAGYQRAEPPILQPASLFLDLSGEDIRGRLFLTTDPAGNEFCLRPEYTIPVCRAYLASTRAGASAQFSYLGSVFRYRPDGVSEFEQAGLESFGRADREAADAEILALALESAAQAGSGPLAIRIGDAGLFNAIIDALGLPSAWVRRIRRGHMRGQSVEQICATSASDTSADHSGVLAALEGVDKQGARALVEDLLSIAGISSVSGRTAGEIAERFLEQAAMKAAAFSSEKRKVLETFLTIAGDPDAASRELRALAKDAKLNLNAALDMFDARTNFLAVRGLDVGAMTFAARFARNLDYYTGFVFEAHDPTRTDGRAIIGGGRYDRLLRTLGASEDIPAVGAAIWCDRLFDGKAAA